jgi:hypothetical protein
MFSKTVRTVALVALFAAALAVAVFLRGRVVAGDENLRAALEWREAGECDLF